MDTLNDVLVKVSAVVAQDISPVDTSTEYSLWRSYANMAQNEWAETYDWPSLYRDYHTTTTTATANTSIALPADFRKLASFPMINETASSAFQFQEIDPSQKMAYDGDRYCFVTYGSSDKSLFVHPKTANLQLISGASIHIPYWKSVASLASPADKIECPNSDYIVQRVIGMIWEAREDSRFQQAKVEAEKILARLLENENTKGEAHINKVNTEAELSYNFRIGRN